MSAQASDIRRAAVTAAVTSAAMIAYQVAAKSTRDALFLSSFGYSALPFMMIASAVVSIVLAGLTSRLIARVGPARVMSVGFLVSAAFLLADWALYGVYRKPIAVAVYLHYAALGGLLISVFWSFLSERFEPRAAKRELGRITAAGTIGGLLGGLLAERVGRHFSVALMLPILAGIHVICAVLVRRLRPLAGDPIAAAREAAARESAARGETSSPIALLRRTPYIQSLVLLVLLVTISEALIDFVFKARAVTMLGRGEELLRLFAAFYTGVALLTVVAQALLSRLALERLGLAGTVATVPATVAVGSAAAIALPGFPSASVLRGSESVLGNSLYRASYELLFTPIPARDKRAVKTLVDVGAARVGDVLGAGLVQAALMAFAVGADRPILLAALGFSLLALPVAAALHAGYKRTLEKSLLTRAVQLDMSRVVDPTTRSMMLQTSGALALSQFLTLPRWEERAVLRAGAPAGSGAPGTVAPATAAATAKPEDAETTRVRALSSREPRAVVHALREAPLTPSILPVVVPLLAWDDVARDVVGALRRMGPAATEDLVARLLDPDTDFAIRRRVPLVLATFRDQRAADGLFRALSDRRFEVRYRSGRALSHLVDLESSIALDAREVFAAALREVAVDTRVWESQRLLDQKMDDAGWSPVVDEVIRDRASRSLEHVFTLLSLAMPRAPLRVAYRGLNTNDPLLRGTALEYLETALPSEIRKRLWPFLEDTRRKRGAPADPKAALDRLLESSESIAINLAELRRGREKPEE